MLNTGEKAKNRKKCQEGSCLFGRRSQKNVLALNTILSEGTYTISIFADLLEDELKSLNQLKSLELNLHLSIESVIAKEDRFNCDAGRLPDTLDFLQDSEGFLRYSDWIFADFSKKKQSTSFTIEKPSVFRVVTVEPQGIDVDLSLFSGKSLVGSSNAVGGAEGLLHELEPGVYDLEISFVNSFVDDTRLKFCETVLVEIGISPQDAVIMFNKKFDLDDCQDTSENLKKWFSDNKEIIAKEKLQLNPSSTFYTLPLTSISKSEERLFAVTFHVPKLAFAYFEIHSDFITGALSIMLLKLDKNSKDAEIVEGSDDALKLGDQNRKSFTHVLKPGKYAFHILSAATAKSLSADGESYTAQYSDSSFKILKKCVAFQLKVRILPTSAKSIESWECKDTDFRLLPKTLNTLDMLGTKDTPVSFMPGAVYFASKVVAPNSFDNVTDSTTFYLESASLLRVLVESSDSPMILTLFKGDDEIEEVKDQTPFIYLMQVKLDQHSTYRLQISYYPKGKKCQTYSILAEILPLTRFKDVKTCNEKALDQGFIYERLMEIGGIFELIMDEGLSSINLEPEVVFKQGKTQYLAEVDLEVTAENALVTGHLLINFAKAGLVMFVKNGDEVIEWGTYRAPHRYELDPIPLATGNYKLVVKEISSSPVGTCVSFKGSLVMEDVAFWNSATSMIKTSETCIYPDLPESLNVIGLIRNNRLDWHQTLMMDTYMAQSFIDFEVTDSVLFSISITPVPSIIFSLQIYRIQEADYIQSNQNKMSGKLGPGRYLLEILYESLFGLPSASICPSFDINFGIIPESDFSSSNLFSCTKSQTLPSSLSFNTEQTFLLFGSLNHQILLSLDESSQVDIFIGYDFLYSGPVRVELIDKSKKLLKKATEDYSFAHLSISLPRGDYFLRLQNDKPFENICWQLSLSYFKVFSESCEGGILPESLTSEDAEAYGGPQHSDGSISFTGRFTFEREKPEQILTFMAQQDSIVRVLTVSQGEFRIESAVYENNVFSSPIGYSKNKSKYASFVFSVSPQDLPYFLVMNLIVEGRGCTVYDLSIEIKPVTSVSNHLKCKVLSHLLPPTAFDLSSAYLYENDELVISDQWMIGDKLPEGVISNGKKNSKFVFQSLVKVKKAGTLEVEAVYDFLTNDLSLEIWNEDSIITSSVWTSSLFDQDQDFSNIGSLLEAVTLSPGTYKLLITQGLVSNHLIQKYPDQTSCFPFDFSLEFTPTSSSKTTKLTSVTPTESKFHNSLTSLILSLKFSKPVKEKDLIFKLKSEKMTTEPDQVMIDPDSSSRVKLVFSAGSLSANICYELAVEGKVETDGLVHKYCTWPCRCNPAAQAQCVESECKCPDPYTGSSCFDCLEGFVMERNVCISLKDEDPRVLSVKTNTEEPVKRTQQLRVYVRLTSAPYNKENEKITRANSQALIDSFFLKSRNQVIKAFTAMPLVKGDNRWVLRFATGDLEYGEVFIVQMVPGLLFTASGEPFKMFEGQEIRVEVADKAENEAECSGHGKEESKNCVCDKGYRGVSCESCNVGYFKTFSGNCEEITGEVEIDSNAKVLTVFPNRPVTVVQSDALFVTIELSEQAFTDEGLLVDALGNTQYLKQVFVLQKGISESFVLAKLIKAMDKEGLKWSLEFDSNLLEIERTYKLIQLDMAIFTKKQKAFAKPDVEMPRFRTFIRIECGNGKQDQNRCVCDKPYTGEQCQDCIVGYFKNLMGECLVQEISENVEKVTKNEEFSFFSTIFYCFCYFALGMAFLWLVGKLRGKQGFDQGYEMVGRIRRKKEDDDEIDLYK
jgi:hypothetical protein